MAKDVIPEFWLNGLNRQVLQDRVSDAVAFNIANLHPSNF